MPNTPVTWLDEFTVNTVTTGSQSGPRITQLANGNILVTWTSADDTGAGSPAGNDVIGRIFDPLGNAVGGEFLVNSGFSAEDEQKADSAALPSGGMLTVYEESTAGGLRHIVLTEADASGGSATTSFAFTDASASADPSGFTPRIAVSSDTSALVIWKESEAGGDSHIQGAIYNSSTNTMGASFGLIDYAGSDSAPSIAALSNGNYVVVTSHNTGTDKEITFRMVGPTGAGILSPTRVAITEGNDEPDTEPAVTALTGGGFVISWSNNDGFDTDTRFQVFTASGAPAGSALLVGDQTVTNDNNGAVIAALQDGGFLVIYDDDQLGQLVAQHYSSAGARLGSAFTIATGANISSIDAVGLKDGRVAVTFQQQNGEIGMEIIDTRDVPNGTPVYTPDSQQIGTIGDDVFGASAAIVHGFKGNDTIADGSGSNAIYGDQGDDDINIDGVSSSESVHGGAGTDTLRGTGMSDGVIYDLSAGTVTLGATTETASGFENIIGSSANETLLGSAAANQFRGGGGNDFIDGRGGTDTVVYTGAWIDYTIGTAGGFTTITDRRAGSPNGTDTLTDVENISFSNGTFDVATAANDAPVGVNDSNAGDAVTEAGRGVAGDTTAAGNVVANDTDADAGLGDTKSVSGARAGKEAAGGSLTAVAGATAIEGQFGTLLINRNGSYTYTLDNSDADTQALAAGATGKETFTYRVTDAGGLSDLAQLVISITGTNDAPVITSNGGGTTGTVTVAENSTAVTTVTSSDVDSGATETYSIAGGADAARFTIDASTGVLSFVTAPDFETPLSSLGTNDYIVSVAVTDGSLIDTQQLTVTVTNVKGVTIDGTAGADTVNATTAPVGEPLPTSEEDIINGFAGNDILNGLGGNDRIKGGADDDRLKGAGGKDALIGGGGNDIGLGGAGNDDLRGGAGTDTLKGGGGNDTLNGGGGADKLLGGGGNDRLIGGKGIDTLSGNSGSDSFVLTKVSADRDIIRDFSHSDDRFEISAAKFGGGLTAGTTLADGQFVTNATGDAGDANDRFIYDTSTDKLFYDADGSGGGAAQLIATFSGVIPVLAANDFLIV